MAKGYLGGGISFEQENVYQEFSEEDTPAGGRLTTLSDVDISNPADGQTLVYNAESGKWENGAGGGGGFRIIRVSNVTQYYPQTAEDPPEWEGELDITSEEMLNAYSAEGVTPIYVLVPSFESVDPYFSYESGVPYPLLHVDAVRTTLTSAGAADLQAFIIETSEGNTPVTFVATGSGVGMKTGHHALSGERR